MSISPQVCSSNPFGRGECICPSIHPCESTSPSSGPRLSASSHMQTFPSHSQSSLFPSPYGPLLSLADLPFKSFPGPPSVNSISRHNHKCKHICGPNLLALNAQRRRQLCPQTHLYPDRTGRQILNSKAKFLSLGRCRRATAGVMGRSFLIFTLPRLISISFSTNLAFSQYGHRRSRSKT